jgi:hypothetical protein
MNSQNRLEVLATGLGTTERHEARLVGGGGRVIDGGFPSAASSGQGNPLDIPVRPPLVTCSNIG